MTRQINRVRFITPVVLGNVDHQQWDRSAPGSTMLGGKILPRMGDPARGDERADSVIFECRLTPNEPYDVEVRAGNIASITREAAPQPQQPKK